MLRPAVSRQFSGQVRPRSSAPIRVHPRFQHPGHANH